jgi:putative transposase
MYERGLLTLPERDWAKAKHRTDVIGSLARLPVVSHLVAEEAAAELGLSMRQVYYLIKRFRASDGLVTDLVPRERGGGKGKSRIASEVGKVISDVIDTLYLGRQKRSEAAIVREVRMRCKNAGYSVPARGTIRARIRQLDPIVVTQSRYGFDATRSLRPAAGKAPEPKHPMEVVQIDHSPMDVIVVEETSREPIGRPHLTLAIDTFTRCIVGMLLTFEAPSATSVGLCLAHTVVDKSVWLERLGLDMEWPMHAKPELIHLDNGPEFHSDALKRGCEQHNINRDYRPKQQPHFGGIIERVIGTAMTKAHELPGTTFSSTQERGKYDSEATAILTLRELEKWLTLAIGTYHESYHSSLWGTPAALWKKSIESCKLFGVKNGKAFLVDFLPVIQRTITRTGFRLDHINYYADVLNPWIARRHSLEKFIIRRDPRDISRVWVLDPISKEYFEIPYRSYSNPSVTLWEHRKAVEKLRERGCAEVNESAIFRMIGQMRDITANAAKEKKRARLEKARRSHLSAQPNSVERHLLNSSGTANHREVRPFDDIEEW